MLEFKLKWYFEKYKDTILISTTRFKKEFTDKHGNFELLPELINMIQKYQYKKYGNLLQTGLGINKFAKKESLSRMEYQRNRNRFGSYEERQSRKLRELHK